MGGSHKLPLWLRWMGLGAGALTLVWLPIEDSQIIFISILGLAWALWIAGWVFTRPPWQGWFAVSQLRLILSGMGLGLIVYPLTLVLIVLKAGLHGHGFMDLSPYQLQGVLFLSPAWVLAGGVWGWAISNLQP